MQPVRWELGVLKWAAYASALKLLLVSVGPTVSQPEKRHQDLFAITIVNVGVPLNLGNT